MLRIAVLILTAVLLTGCVGPERVVDRNVEYVGTINNGSSGYQLIFTDDNGNTYDYYVGSIEWLPDLVKGERYDVKTIRYALEIGFEVQNIFKVEEEPE